MSIHPLWQAYPELQKELVETQKIMKQAVKIRNQEITAALQDVFQAGGKLLRPAYFLLFTHFGQAVAKTKKYQLAASLEILHVASLIHDDIIDEAPIRRGIPSIQSAYGKDIAVYTGDFLFTVYFQLLAASSNSFKTIDFNARNMKKILIGELDQMHLRYNTEITIKQYFRHIKGKTAQLFQLSCYEGATYANSSVRICHLSQRIGYQIGMAFQILDDILDYTAEAEELQKPVLEDVRNGNYTLPLILALEKAPEQLKPLLAKKAALTDQELREIAMRVKAIGGLDKAQQFAERFTNQALQNISKLPEIPERAILLELTQNLLQRKN